MHPLSDRLWTHLIERTDHIRDAQTGRFDYAAKVWPDDRPRFPMGTGRPVNFHRLAARVRRELAALGEDLEAHRAKAPRAVKPPEAVIPRAQAHMAALSRIVAARANTREDVRQVRKLRGRRALERAEELAATLATETGWTRSEAMRFLLSDGALVAMQAVSDRPRAGRYMTLSVDPIVSPQELARAYGEMRRAVVGAERKRRLTPKHLELAVFMAEHPASDKPLWGKRMAAWNAGAPKKWRYRQETNFARDCVAAQRRMEDTK